MNIYRTIQEAVNNSMKYSDAKSIKIGIKNLKNAIEINVEDDGKGFDSNKVELGNGTANMKKRIAEINETISIDSDASNGTKITIIIPHRL